MARQEVRSVPTIAELLRMVEKGSYRTHAHEFLSDLFECGAIAVSNRFDFPQAAEREKRYMQIIGKYDTDTQKIMTEMFAKIFSLLTQQIEPSVGFNDYLGELYMRSETSNSKAGQFFTPYCVSKLCAEVTIDEVAVNQCMEQNKILTMNEPACGAGGMIIAAADVLHNKYNFNIAHNFFVECSDIDSRCVHMTYLQLGLAGIPAIIYQRNTITLETWDCWKTPAYLMQWLRFNNQNNIYRK